MNVHVVGITWYLRLHRAVTTNYGYRFTLNNHIMVVRTLTDELTDIRPNAYGETLRGLQSNLPFGEVFPLTVPVIWMPTSMSRLVSLRLSCPWQARESLDFLLRCHTLLSGLAVLSWTVPNVSPLAMILSLRWKKKLHLFLVFILSSSPTALSYHTSPWLNTPVKEILLSAPTVK